MEQKEIEIYSDGACLGNPGRGGWSAILKYGDKRKEISGGFRLTTNNRMELYAIIQALKAINKNKKYNIIIYSDSNLIISAFTKGWIDKWIINNWKRNKKDKVLNEDLWKELLNELTKHNVKFIWIKGHAGNPENELCDRLAKAAASGNNFEIDKAYEESSKIND